MRNDEFISLDAWFALGRAVSPAPPSEDSAIVEPLGDATDGTRDEAREHVVAESRRWYARLHDALDAACERLLCELAAGVLARELQLAPCDLAAVLAGVREEMLGEPLCVRLHPDDCALWNDPTLPCRADAALAPGDAVLELREGSIDARFGVRLQAVLDACTA